MNYDEFNEETKTFLKRAMDIYFTIKEKDIHQIVKKDIYQENYRFTKLDKKILSLFIAGYMTNGNLKEILEEYDDIKLEDLLSFIAIDEKQIKKIDDDKYLDFYTKNFKLDIINILKNGIWKSNEINYVSPEIIISCLQYTSFIGSDIFNYFKNKYNIKGLFFSEHPIFSALKNYALINGIVKINDLSKENVIDTHSLISDLSFFEKDFLAINEQLDIKKSTTINLTDEKIWILLDEIKKKFIGQEQATEGLFYNIINNQQLVQTEEIPDDQRSIIFVDGPTGTGKTAITKEITEKLDIPFTSTSVTNYSSTGYVGRDITDVLKELYRKSDGDIEKAQRGIIVFDEFDKIAYSRSFGLEMRRAVQQQLLDLLGGGKYIINVGNSIFGVNEFDFEIEFDTSKLTFICFGALTDLRTQKTEHKHSIGFGQSNMQDKQLEYTITPHDLIEIGLERELVGRFNTYLHTNDYDRDTLITILKKSTISPLIGFRKWIESKGKKLEIDEDVYDLIADQAYKLNTGARSLQTVINNIRTFFIKEVLRGTNPIIHLDSETVLQINKQIISRKGRV